MVGLGAPVAASMAGENAAAESVPGAANTGEASIAEANTASAAVAVSATTCDAWATGGRSPPPAGCDAAHETASAATERVAARRGQNSRRPRHQTWAVRANTAGAAATSTGQCRSSVRHSRSATTWPRPLPAPVSTWPAQSESPNRRWLKKSESTKQSHKQK